MNLKVTTENIQQHKGIRSAENDHRQINYLRKYKYSVTNVGNSHKHTLSSYWLIRRNLNFQNTLECEIFEEPATCELYLRLLFLPLNISKLLLLNLDSVSFKFSAGIGSVQKKSWSSASSELARFEGSKMKSLSSKSKAL